MAAEVRAFVPAPANLGVNQSAATSQNKPSPQDLLRDLHDMLFVIAGAAVHLKANDADRNPCLVDNLLEAAKRATDSATALAAHVTERAS